jgi:hypothetical protein
VARTRAEWDARHPWNEPYPPWRLATRRERGASIGRGFIGAVMVLMMFVSAMALLSLAVDTQTHRAGQKTRCLQQATDGLEIRRCER